MRAASLRLIIVLGSSIVAACAQPPPPEPTCESDFARFQQEPYKEPNQPSVASPPDPMAREELRTGAYSDDRIFVDEIAPEGNGGRTHQYWLTGDEDFRVRLRVLRPAGMPNVPGENLYVIAVVDGLQHEAFFDGTPLRTWRLPLHAPDDRSFELRLEGRQLAKGAHLLDVLFLTTTSANPRSISFNVFKDSSRFTEMLTPATFPTTWAAPAWEVGVTQDFELRPEPTCGKATPRMLLVFNHGEQVDFGDWGSRPTFILEEYRRLTLSIRALPESEERRFFHLVMVTAPMDDRYLTTTDGTSSALWLPPKFLRWGEM
jgi:hypothetical protein